MLPIQPIGERTAISPLYGTAPATTIEAPVPAGVAVDVTPYGQLLGTLAVAQQRFGDLARGDGNDPNDIAQLGLAAGELAEAFNLGRNLPLPGQATLPDQLTDALDGQQRALAGAGIDITPDGRLNVDSRRLLAAYERDRQGTLKALEEAARRFAEAGNVQETQQQNVAAQQDVLEQLQLAAQQQVLRQQQMTEPEQAAQQQVPSAPVTPGTQVPVAQTDRQAAPTKTEPEPEPEPVKQEPTLEDRAAAARLAAQAAQRRVQALADERRAIEAAELERRQQEDQMSAQAEADNIRAQRLAEQRLADQQAAATRQMDLTQEARQAARRLDLARDMVAAQAAAPGDIATQDQRLAEARAAALRQLTSSAQEDDAAQALADRLARERDVTAQAAQADDTRRTEERLDAARREAIRPASPAADEEVRMERFETGSPADAFDVATLAGPDDVLDDAVVPGSAARESAAVTAGPPPAPNAADPAMAAAIAAQRLAGGIPGGAHGHAPPPPPRTQQVPPVAAVTSVAAAEGSRTKPRGGT